MPDDDSCRLCGAALRSSRCAVCGELDELGRDEDLARRRAERLLAALSARGLLVLSGRFAARGLAERVAVALARERTLEARAAGLADFLVRQPEVTELFASDAELAAAIARVALEPAPPDCGAFALGALRFVVGAPPPRARAVGELFACGAFERELGARDARVAARVGPAPWASWVLARVAALTREPPPLPRELVAPGGGWSFALRVERAGVPVATCALCGDVDGVAVRGDARDARNVGLVLAGLATALVAAPDALAPCEVRVRDPDWHRDPGAFAPPPALATRARYGFADGALLGADNPRRRPR